MANCYVDYDEDDIDEYREGVSDGIDEGDDGVDGNDDDDKYDGDDDYDHDNNGDFDYGDVMVVLLITVIQVVLMTAAGVTLMEVVMLANTKINNYIY